MLRSKKDAPSDDVAVAAPDVVQSAKKDLPPAALAGIAVGVLALLGLAAYFMFFRAPAPSATPPLLSTTMPGMMGANSVSAPGMPGAAPGMPGVAPGGMGATTAVSPGASAPGTMTTGGAAPGGAMSVSRSTTTAGAAPQVPVISAAPVRPGPGAPPTLAPPSAAFRPNMTPITSTLKAQLNILWQRGADAKHNGDFNAARGYWNQALRLRPGHPGFAEAIRKLPPQQGNRRR